jgi:hypothetical protein
MRVPLPAAMMTTSTAALFAASCKGAIAALLFVGIPQSFVFLLNPIHQANEP